MAVEKTFAVQGWVRVDDFGRIVIDRCPSDQEHLVSAPTDPEINKPSCRYLLEEFFTRGSFGAATIGHRGTLCVTVTFEEEAGRGA